MAAKLEITEYIELLGLHKALHIARFSINPLSNVLSGNPYLAELAKRTLDTLAQMEIERGKPERADAWQFKIDSESPVWQIAVQNAAAERRLWRPLSKEEKVRVAQITLTPYIFTDEMIELFIQHVDDLTEE